MGNGQLPGAAQPQVQQGGQTTVLAGIQPQVLPPQEAVRDPIRALGIASEPVPPFVRMTGELVTNGVPCPELDALCRNHDPAGNGSSEHGFSALCTLSEEQVRPLIEQAKRDLMWTPTCF